MRSPASLAQAVHADRFTAHSSPRAVHVDGPVEGEAHGERARAAPVVLVTRPESGARSGLRERALIVADRAGAGGSAQASVHQATPTTADVAQRIGWGVVLPAALGAAGLAGVSGEGDAVLDARVSAAHRRGRRLGQRVEQIPGCLGGDGRGEDRSGRQKLQNGRTHDQHPMKNLHSMAGVQASELRAICERIFLNRSARSAVSAWHGARQRRPRNRWIVRCRASRSVRVARRRGRGPAARRPAL